MSPLNTNLRGLLAIRFIVLALQCLALAYSQWVLKLALPHAEIMWGILAIFLFVIAMLFRRLRNRVPVTETEFLLQLLIDVIVLSLLMFLSGGANNPFVSFLLVPVMISATTLSRQYTWGITGLALLCYTALLFWYLPLPELIPAHSDDMAGMAGMQQDDFNLHIAGMWFNFVVSAGLIAWYVVKMASELRHQQEQLAALRESTLRDEQIMAVATQAADTAHALGTPLSTMAVVLSDLELALAQTEHGQDVSMLKKQVDLCKATLQKLVSDSDPQLQLKQVRLNEFIDDLLDHWQLLKPEIKVSVSRCEDESKRVLESSEGLQQAIINLLNNAAEAGNGTLTVASSLDDSNWYLRILDSGEGITEDLKSKLGIEKVTSSHGGMGMGYMLSHATIERAGGRVSLDDADDGGTVTFIQLPAGTES